MVGFVRGLRPALGVALMALSVAVPGCADDEVEPGEFRSLPEQGEQPVLEVPAPLGMAHCDVNVEGQGVIDMETDYLPHVVQCENGGANLEALKAQAVAARSVGYYNMETQGSICDSQGCQVYGCGVTPTATVYQAVQETSGQYLMYNATLTYGFYVAGDNGVSPPSCVGNPNVGTESWVTYNEGQSGTNVTQTALGFIHNPGDNGYGQNRGCMSQWGARCLENNNGYDYVDILRFYYGDDIEIVQAQGACVLPLDDGGGGSTGDPGMDTGSVDPTMTDGGAVTDAGSVDTGTDPSAGGDASASGAGTGGSASASGASGISAGADGTDGVDDGFDTEEALPDTFGGVAGDGGCTCTSAHDGPASVPGWAFGLPLVVLWRRRRRR